MAKRKKTRVDRKGQNAYEQYVGLPRKVARHAAYIALTSHAKVLYLHIKMEAYGERNGKVRMTVEQATKLLNVSPNTANKAFHDLQAKGFIVLTDFGTLGVEGKRSSPSYAVTEYCIPPEEAPRLSFLDWKPGHDFPVQRHGTNNPNGWNGKTHLKT